MEELKHKIEALLFSAGRFMSLEEIRKICKISSTNEIENAIKDLKVDYDNRDTSLILINEADKWKITTKEDYFHVVKKVVTETDLSKTLLETLAVIAWKYPIKQCALIKIRTNKAYDHLNELESMGYISRQKSGRTKLIKLTDRFFEYFDLPPEKLKERFSDFSQIAKVISEKEQEIEKMKDSTKKEAELLKQTHEIEEEKQKQDLEKQEKEIDLLDDHNKKVKLETYNQEAKEQKDSLETYDFGSEDKKEDLNEELKKEEEKQSIPKKSKKEKPKIFEEKREEEPSNEIEESKEQETSEKSEEKQKNLEEKEENNQETQEDTESLMEKNADAIVEKLLGKDDSEKSKEESSDEEEFSKEQENSEKEEENSEEKNKD